MHLHLVSALMQIITSNFIYIASLKHINALQIILQAIDKTKQ